MIATPALSMTDAPDDDAWLARFHAGDRAALESCYREQFGAVERAVGSVLTGADRETAIHEVFLRIIARADLRRAFHGGSLAAWLATVARNHAIDYLRRHGRERPAADPPREPADPSFEERTQARLLVERFRRERLPARWAGVFEARFLRQLPQREAAAALGMRRTTLAYQELRIRALLRKFLLKADGS